MKLISNSLSTDERMRIRFFEYWHRRRRIRVADKHGRAVSGEIGRQLFASHVKITKKRYSI